MAEQMTGAQMVIQALADQGVEHVFGYPGGAVLPIYDELFHQDKLRHILVRHEQGAVHAAEGYARSTGTAGRAQWWSTSPRTCNSPRASTPGRETCSSRPTGRSSRAISKKSKPRSR